MQLMRAGGHCTFCGAVVRLAHAACQAVGLAPNADHPVGAPSAAQRASIEDSSATAATAAAQDFRDRLLAFDRTAAAHTAVIDDHGDFFEVEGNVWMSPGEREEARAQQSLQEVAERARRSRVAVTIDLVGRQVCLTVLVHCGFSWLSSL
jgi:hypothetical protein